MATAATGCWADLHSDLLVSIATAADKDLSLKNYMCLRGVCTAWRSALASPNPCLLSLADERLSVFSLPMRRRRSSTVAYSYSTLDESRSWMGISRTARLVGSGNGRLAITLGRWIDNSYRTEKILVVGPNTGEEVKILPPITQGWWHAAIHKIVFAPGPDDGTIVAIYDQKKVSYIDTSSSSRDDMKWTAVDLKPAYSEHLVDLVFDDGAGKEVQTRAAAALLLGQSEGSRRLCSVFVGKNSSPTVARAGALPGVQPDCVYWIDRRGAPMVCDVATGTSKPCVLPCGAGMDNCWFF